MCSVCQEPATFQPAHSGTVTGEYASGLIRTTLAAAPQRLLLLGALGLAAYVIVFIAAAALAIKGRDA